ncbi:MAG: isopeptide-forming domain-containing fimbrial protein, partial [Patescibacteria group bacterium]
MNTKNIFIQIASILALVAVFYAGYSATAYITGTLTAADALGCGSCGTVINLDGGGGGGGFGGGGADGGGGGGGGYTPALPYCTLTASIQSASIPAYSVLQWTSANATSIVINQGIGSVTPVASGFRTVSPQTTTTYTATVTSASGATATCSTTITVTTPPMPPQCTLELTKDMISWTTSYANNVQIVPLTNSPQVPGATGGSTTGSSVQHTEGDAFTSAAVLQDINASGISFTSTYTGTAFAGDQATMDRVCTLIDGSGATASAFYAEGFDSPSGNYVVKWTGSSWTKISATQFNSHLRYNFTCAKPPTPSTYPLSGYHTFVPPLGVGTHTYHLTATGPGGVAHCEKTVVVPPPPPEKPTCVLSASPKTIEKGYATALSWVTTNTTTFVIDHSVGSVTPVASGIKTVAPTYTTTYTGTATGPGGTVTCSETVTVTTPPPPPPPPTCTFTAMPYSLTSATQSTVLSWTTTNATIVSIDQGVGAVTPASSGSKTVVPGTTKTYTLTATGPGGAVECQKTVKVKDVPPPPPPLPSCVLSASPTTITTFGGSSTLSWTTDNASSISIDNGIGSVTPVAGGSKVVSPTDTTTYKATVTGPGGTATCKIIIKVECGLPPPPPPPEKPTCTLSASPSEIKKGNTSTLTWSTTHATTFTIDRGIGSVTPIGGGLKSVSPTETTVYTGVATGPGGSVECKRTVKVKDTPPPPGECKMTIEKSANKSSVVEGDIVEYTINFKNIGNADCTGGGVRVSDVIDSRLTYQSETHASNVSSGYGSDPVYKSSDRTVRWNAHELSPGDSGWVKFKAKVGKPASCSETIPNKAKITSKEYSNFTDFEISNVVDLTATRECSVPPPVCSATLSAHSIQRGQSVTLAWTSNNAASMTFDQGINSVTPVSGGTTGNLTPQNTTTYTGTATGPGGTVTCTDTVIVEAPPGPACTLTTSATRVRPGESAVLSWTSSNTTEGFINNGVGSTTPVAAGSITIFPTSDLNYTGTFKGPNGTVQCQVFIGLQQIGCTGSCGGGGLNQPNVVLYQKPGDAPLAFVSLTQIPYTGFEAGPALTLIFWLAVAGIAGLVTFAVMGRSGVSQIVESIALASAPPQYKVDVDTRFVQNGNGYTQGDSAAYSASVSAAPSAVAEPVAVFQQLPLAEIIEGRAHAAGVLMSPEAVITASTLGESNEVTLQKFGALLDAAIRMYPREDGWVLLTSDRMTELDSITV